MKSTNTYSAALKAAATVHDAWAAHYAATNQDIRDGITTRDISAAWKKAKITGPTSVAMVSSMGDAMELAGLKGGAAYPAAVEKVYGEGTMLPVHVLLERVRKAHGVAHYRAILKALKAALAVAADDEEQEKAIVKAVRELKAGSKAVKHNSGNDDEGQDDEGQDIEGDEGDEGDETPEPKAASASDKAASIAAVANSLRKDLEGGAVLSDDMMAALMAELSALASVLKKAGKAAA